MLTATEVAQRTKGFSDYQKSKLRRKLWQEVGRPEQRLPDGTWPTFLCRGGRGSGKTRTGAEGLADLIFANWDGEGDWAVIGPTFADARDTCMEGQSGLLRTLAGLYDERKWNRSHGQLHLRNGSIVFCDGANDGALRIQGKNLRGAWCDEIGLWRRGRAGVQDREHQEWWEIAWDESLAFAVRIMPAQIIATGTPKRGHPLVKRLIDDPRVPSVRLRMVDNLPNLAKHRVEDLLEKYRGTALEAQELEGEYLDHVEGALWSDLLIAETRWQPEWGEPVLSKTYIGVDPSGGAAEIGIVAAGLVKGRCPCGVRTELPHYAVVADCTTRGTPEHWANAVHVCAERWDADAILGERNYGGDMVESTIRAAARNDRHPYEDVNASKGKVVRAEPISRVYEQGRVHHVGTFDLLEGEMTTYIQGGPSPNRLDACLVGTTPVMTRRGDVPIDQVQIGDEVWTRVGWRQVEASRLTGIRETITVELSNGQRLFGTPDHRVWSTGRWSRLDALQCGDTLSGWSDSPTEESFTPETQRESNEQGVSIGQRPEVLRGRSFTGTSTWLKSVPFPTVGTSIISTTTLSTTSLPTWSRFHQANMRRFTLARSIRKAPTGWRIWRQFARRLRSGMVRLRASSGIDNTGLRRGKGENRSWLYAKSAAERWSDGSTESDTVRRSVKVGRQPGDTTKMRRVRSAAVPFNNDTGNPKPVVVLVERIYESGTWPVYDLQINDQHEFVASGVLVHNCVWAMTKLSERSEGRGKTGRSTFVGRLPEGVG